ncbi:hypothetical protein K402DRAFT_359166 [Aulographum hederae CBS 113979]|uniref:C2 domain-containing protein n=1 Tax=Aulographum hederae CBS 113979 TaxID=1176131 RepID=A0A6G1GV17_9PEZI|nr:hypothetical protein K402DRAFT_359166 [Aulographum hederae CBS 113979]
MSEEEKRSAPAQDAQTPEDESRNNSEKTLEEPSEKSNEDGQAKEKPEQQEGPAGGFDATPVSPAPPGYTVKITFHRAHDLPMADINSLSSDPYILAQLNTSLPSRHKEDPYLRLRTPTVRRSTEPVWDFPWIIDHVPATGFKLKARIYDEDPADHDDRLGNVHVSVPALSEDFPGIKEGSYKIKKRMGSKRAYAIRAITTCLRTTKHFGGHLVVSVEILGRSQGDGGRAYTVGPMWWTRHYSPLLGRITGQKDPGDDEPTQGENHEQSPKSKTERYDFQANQFQLRGPVPWQLYHRFVEFKPFVKGMFTSKGIRGFLMSKALHHQHARVYNFDRSTLTGRFDHPSHEATMKFLDLVHYDQGGRIFTYVLTLDALFRFTETGKEFGIDMLSKHTMHSDVSIYIAFSGEFFIRRLKHPHEDPTQSPQSEHNGRNGKGSLDENNPSHPPDSIGGGPPGDEPVKDPKYYELVIDNDSGTYRPNAKMLPLLKDFLQANFVGLKVVTLDCQGDAELMGKMKDEQREKKKREGSHIVYRQGSLGSSISSSDEEELDEMAGGQMNGAARP